MSIHATYITHAFARHVHEIAIGVIEKGAEAFSYRGGKHIAPAGSIVVINPQEVHTGNAADETGWTYRMLYPSVRLLQQIAFEACQQQQEPYFPVAVIQDHQLKMQILQLHQSLENSKCRLENDSRLLWTFAQLMTYTHLRPISNAVGRESQAVKRVREYLEANYLENISLDAIASIANLSPFYLLRTFRAAIGLPPHSYLKQVRIFRAKALLSQGHSIAEVAHNTGFADQSHLTRHFKRIVGVTPGQYQGKNVQD